ncbi:DUF1501 domain-containing protein [Planctomyces sp. SH-PL62]|uniref:DUF1501 domain-containing protein n=1 Tax=Planctomyces sp. SH-PL62 TaxID=1636152 RepID=UPI00078D4EC4|nr:DUF1501 domain-containing protein [Planctomyces sp. SH-PL62]AMV38629.1 hypothetical protein VT85_14420 [Planctomyces sp. SH-PL62]
MSQNEPKSGRRCRGVDRREFLRAGGVGLGALTLSGTGVRLAASEGTKDRAVILLMLVGGPSQLETFDPKPDAPEEVRGPFGSIATRVPGVRVSEHLPRLAARMDRLALIRSLNHDEAPIHETGLQLLQTGRLSRTDEHPHFGATTARFLGRRRDASTPAFAAVPGPIGNTGVELPRGQTAGELGTDWEPAFLAADRPSEPLADPRLRRALSTVDEPSRRREAYGSTRFGRDCLAARRLVEAGVRVVTVNMYESVFDRVTWDCHGARPFSTLDDYRREVLPTFDRAFSALLDDLHDRGMLETTLVAAVGEFGRSPRINASGGRDHWPGVWSAVLAGGGVRGGRVIGASDVHAATPVDRPVSPQEWVATMYHALGVDPSPIAGSTDAEPIYELFS